MLRRNLGMVAIYGLVAVAGCQVFYFNAVQHLSVGVALLLEYMGIVLVVGWLWLRSGQRPRPAHHRRLGRSPWSGWSLVLDLVGDTQHRPGRRALGPWRRRRAGRVLRAVGQERRRPAAAGDGQRRYDDRRAWRCSSLGAVGVLPMHATTDDVDFAGHAGQLAGAGPRAVPGRRRDRLRGRDRRAPGCSGSKLASFVGLTEVLFAVLFAWLLLGQLPTVMQLLGGVLIVAGSPWSGSTSCGSRAAMPISCPVRRLWASRPGVPEPRPTTLSAGRIRVRAPVRRQRDRRR